MILKILIEILERCDQAAIVAHGFAHPHSYRGYYDQLAFEKAQLVTVGSMTACAKEALGSTYSGWKGGEYTMGEYTNTNLVDKAGRCGEPIGEMLLYYMLGNADVGSAEKLRLAQEDNRRLRNEVEAGLRDRRRWAALQKYIESAAYTEDAK